MKSDRLPIPSHLNQDLCKGCIGRAVSVILILVLAGGYGSPVVASSVVEGLSAAEKQMPGLSRFLPELGFRKSTSPVQEFSENPEL